MTILELRRIAHAGMLPRDFAHRLTRRIDPWARDAWERCRLAYLRLDPPEWPCMDRKYLVVGCESSGTTPIALLLLGKGVLRYRNEDARLWQIYISVYQGRARVRDYPILQLYDAMKIPGFAAILPEYREMLPNSQIVYVVRDPRDVVNSAFNTWKAKTVEQLSKIDWCAQTWLGITSEDPIVRLALRWRIYLRKSMQTSGVIYVRYEDFCKDKVGFIRSLSKQVGVECNEGFVDRYCNQQASHPASRAYAPTGPGGWKRGPLATDDILKIEDICSEEMRLFGYGEASTEACRSA